MKSRQTAHHAIDSRGSKRIDLVWRSCLSAGLNNINKGFPKASLEHNEAIILLYCSFSSHGPIRRTDQSQYHFGIETPAGWLLRRKVVPILPTAIPHIIARSRESRRIIPSSRRGYLFSTYHYDTARTPESGCVSGLVNNPDKHPRYVIKL